ncbi:MAG: BamA/TamA family outer membrane protein, partial [FCB group bacterium]|nr:BamA/TamA family outer membrane protein [FCB group bacterium]
TVLATTLADLDTVRLVKVNPSRRATTGPLAIRPAFSRWQNHHPPDTLSAFNPRLSVDTMTRERYRFYRHPRHLASLVFPYFDGHGLFGTTSWMDAMGRHIIQVAGGLAWTGPEKPWLLVSYLNGASWMPWGINYFSNSRWDFRYYDQSASGLNEQLDGLDLYAQYPLNFGQSLSSNHSLNINLGLYNRRADAIYDSVDSETGIIFPRDPADFRDLPVPESGREGLLSIYYQWINRRPNRNNIILPTQGGGLILRSDFADQSLFGDFTFSRWEADGFINLPTGDGMALYVRLKGQAMGGKPAAQDSLGLTRDPNIYLPTGLLNAGIFVVPENNNPRGWDDVRLGNRVLFGTVEYRIPLIPQLPIEILGLTLGSVTGAAIMDFGNAWISGKPQPEWVVTTGYEVKIGIQAGKTPLIFVAIGQAQPPMDWDAGITPGTYARLALINPF